MNHQKKSLLLMVALTVSELFKELKDRHLLKFGVPEEQIPYVRKIQNESQLDKMQAYLPTEAYEALFLYLAGENYENIILECEIKEDKTYDVNDFSEALERTQSKAHFVVPADETALIEMLNAPMKKWRVFLHPSQRKIAFGKKNGPVRVLGGAGTGKTVVAIHRAKWLAQQNLHSDKRILFTTFTRNLAIDIQENLKSICSEEELSKIEVVNLDRWVQSFLRKQSYDYQVIFDNKTSEKILGKSTFRKAF